MHLCRQFVRFLDVWRNTFYTQGILSFYLFLKNSCIQGIFHFSCFYIYTFHMWIWQEVIFSKNFDRFSCFFLTIFVFKGFCLFCCFLALSVVGDPKWPLMENYGGVSLKMSDNLEPEFMTIFVTIKWHWTAFAILAMF